MSQSKPRRNGQLLRKADLQGRWFGREHYEKSQPYNTFLRPRVFRKPNEKRILLVAEAIRKLVPNCEVASALEIGPGDTPVISTIPFGRKVFIDQSEAILRQLPKGNHRVAGDVRHLPIKGRFDVVVANEVFTHLTPRDRKIAIHEIIRHANSIIILDRPHATLEDIRRFMIARRIRARGHLHQNRNLEKMMPGVVIIPSVKELEKKYDEARRIKTKNKQVLRSQQRELVDFAVLQRELQRNGWDVNLSPAGDSGGYALLTAHKK